MRISHKLALLLITCCVIISSLIWVSNALDPQPEPPSEIHIILDGKLLELDTNPIIINDRVMIPMRALFESLGAEIAWDDATKSVTAKKGTTVVKLTIGKSTAYVTVGNVTSNIKLDVSPRIINDRTMVPARFVSESLGAFVDWIGETSTVIIRSNGADVSNNGTDSNADNSNETQPGAGSDNTQSNSKEQPDTTDINIFKASDIGSLFKNNLITSTSGTRDYINKIVSTAKPFDSAKLIATLPASLDYTEYLSLTRNQGVIYDKYNDKYCGIGWCYDMANLHCTDMIKEMENKYTPDLSLWYLRYNDAKLFTDGMLEGNQEKVLSDGLCTETQLPSDYIHARIDPEFESKYSYKKDANGNIVTYLNLDPMPKPTAEDIAEAASYKITKNTAISDPKTNEIKSLLYKYGPIWACGPYQSILGENPAEYHVMTIVGFDDSKQTFKILNSWGNKWNGSGFMELPYANVDKEISAIQYFENISSDRTGAKAYSGRVVIEHPLRNQLFVEVGVEGRTPLIVWMGPNRGKEVGIYDNSMNLTYDFPLPDYAKDCWPPSNTNKWYIRVGDNKTDSYMGYIKSFTLAHIKDNPNNKSVDKTTLETYTANFDTSSGKISQYNYYCDIGTKFYYTPPTGSINNISALAATYSFKMTTGSELEMEKPAATTIKGTLSSTLLGSTSTVSSKEVGVYQLIQGPCVNIPAKWTLVSTVKTDYSGNFSFTFTPNNYGAYWFGFAVTDSSNKVIASGEPTVVKVGPLIDKLKIDLKNIPRIIPDTINPNINPDIRSSITLPSQIITPGITIPSTPGIISPTIPSIITPTVPSITAPSISPSITR